MVRSALAAALVLAACAGPIGCGEEAVVGKDPAGSADAAEQARIESSRKKIDEASLATDEKRYADANKLLKEAEALNIESHRFEIQEAREKLDKREAKLWSNEVSEQLDGKQCAEAFASLSKEFEARKSEIFKAEVKKLVHTQAVACTSGKLDELATAGKFGEARSFLGSPSTKVVLGEAAWKKLSAETEGTATEAMAGQLAEDLQAKRWAAAADKVDAAVKRGDVTEAAGQNLMGRVRAAAAPELTAKAAQAVGSRSAAADLKDVDALIARLGWEVQASDLAGIAKDKAMPEDLGKKRAALATYVETQRLKLKPLKKAEKRWMHGLVPLAPAGSAEGASRRDLKQGTAVWVLGQTKDVALITEADPGGAAFNAALDLAAGWVPVRTLAKEDTAEWLPPNDQLKGLQVWGPLREKQAFLELGTVTEVKGEEVTVTRLADDVAVKTTRDKLRKGQLVKGMKVLTLCDQENQPATIFEHIQGMRVARVQCDSGLQKEQPLSSLRSRPDLLPASK
ncbi:hypothetical protein [Chondromyces apiculatus]|uniref:Uncharacterized protein n=1 Tax=Chondromyces apiculatus DSM 436 TaxID=1192034 RepID=A0A017T0U5_9BACT|nr:hypothetical protein [Chondromyces apiculatus]EYF02475.1 Hypothetical protein CAP_7097 [Chondromyces apiculatus DSM 436]